MSSISSVTSAPMLPVPIALPQALPQPEKAKKACIFDQPNFKRIDNPQRMERAEQLLIRDSQESYVYDRVLMLPKPYSMDPSEKISVHLQFHFTVHSLLERCTAALQTANFRVKERVFKGGAIHFLLDGYPPTLRDFDVGLVIERPENPGDWFQIHQIILSCIEKEAGLSTLSHPKSPVVTFTTHDERTSMAVRDGKKSLFEHGGLDLMWGWWLNPKVLRDNEEYAIYAIPANPFRVELEVVAAHGNSATCSLDALRFHYDFIDGEFCCGMTAVDGYDVHRALSLRRKGFFYCRQDRIPYLREGLYRYCSHLLKGYLSIDFSDETAFCRAFFNNPEELQKFYRTLPKFIKNHTSSKEDRIRYLLNLDAILNRYTEIAGEKKLSFRRYIAYLLWEELDIQKVPLKPDEMLTEMQLMRDYIYLLAPQDCHTPHSYPKRTLSRIDYPKSPSVGLQAREQGCFVVEPPDAESLKKYAADNALNACAAFQKLAEMFPNGKKDAAAFFKEKLEVKREPKEEKQEPLPPFFSDIASFADYFQKKPEPTLKRMATYLLDLFSSNAVSLKLLDSQTDFVKQALTKVKTLLMTKDRLLAVSLFKEVFKTKFYAQKEIEALALEIIPTLLKHETQNDFTEALGIFYKIVNKIPFETTKKLILCFLEAPVNPKISIQLLASLDVDPSNEKEVVELFEMSLKKIEEKEEYIPCLMTFWRILNESKPEKSTRFPAAVEKFAAATLALLSKSKDEKVLQWAYEIMRVLKHPLLEQTRKQCTEFVNRGISERGKPVLSFYKKYAHVVFNNESKDRFIVILSSFIRSILQMKEYSEANIAAVNWSVDRIIQKKFPPEAAQALLPLFIGEKIHSGLQKAYKKLKKFANPPHAATQTFHQIKQRFIETGSPYVLSHALDMLKALKESPHLNIEAIFAAGLEIFEEGMRLAKQGNDKVTQQLPTLRNLMTQLKKYEEWSEDEKAILDEPLPIIEPKNSKKEKEKKEKAIVSKSAPRISLKDRYKKAKKGVQNRKIVFYTPHGQKIIDSRDFFDKDPDADFHKELMQTKISKEKLHAKLDNLKKNKRLLAVSMRDKMLPFLQEIFGEDGKGVERVNEVIASHEASLRKNPAGSERIFAELVTILCIKQQNSLFTPEDDRRIIIYGDKLLPFLSYSGDQQSLYSNQAVSFLNLGQPESAISCLKQAFTMGSETNLIKLFIIASVFTKDWTSALKYAKEIPPDEKDSHVSYFIGFYDYIKVAELCNDKKFEEAIDLLESFPMNKHLVSKLLLLGHLYSELHNDLKALTYYQNVLLYLPNHTTALFFFENLNKKRKEEHSKADSVIPCRMSPLQVAASSIASLEQMLGPGFVEWGYLKAIIGEHEAKLKTNPKGNELIWNALLLAYLKSKDYKNVIRCAEKALEYPLSEIDKSLIYRYRARARFALGNTETTMKDFEYSLNVMPDSVDALACVMESYIYTERWEEALEKITVMKPKCQTPWLARYEKIAKACLEKQYHDAIKTFEENPIQDACENNKLYLIGCLYEKMNEPFKALVFYESLHARMPDLPKVLLKLGEINKKINVSAGIDFYNRVLTVESSVSETVAANAALGGLYCQKKDWHASLCRYAAWYVKYVDLAGMDSPANKLIFRYVLNRFIDSVFKKQASASQIKIAKVTLASVLAKLSSKAGESAASFKPNIELAQKLLLEAEKLPQTESEEKEAEKKEAGEKSTDAAKTSLQHAIDKDHASIIANFSHLHAEDQLLAQESLPHPLTA